MATLEFNKMHGCGNDYIYIVALRARPADPGALSVKLSDRHFGVGGDGLILLAPSSNADIRMEMYNADGSRGAMCGNGIRCLARLAFERGLVRVNPMVVETDAGLKTVELRLQDRRVVAATVDMGEPILEGRDIPADAVGRIVDYPLDVAGMHESVTAVSMGNPHCVVFVADDAVFGLPDRDFAELGRKFEHHPFFPDGVNTEFIRAVSRRNLRMRVWERGSGETWACGTGACAAVVAAVLTNHSDRTATVELRGGNLEIEWRADGADANHVFMTGNAVEVFRGEVELGVDEMVAVS